MISCFIAFIMPFAAFWKYNSNPHWSDDEQQVNPVIVK